MGAIASQITSLTSVYSTVYSDADQRKHQSSASLAFVRGIHQGPENSPHKWPVTRKMFPLDDVILMKMLVLNATSAESHSACVKILPRCLTLTFQTRAVPCKVIFTIGPLKLLPIFIHMVLLALHKLDCKIFTYIYNNSCRIRTHGAMITIIICIPRTGKKHVANLTANSLIWHNDSFMFTQQREYPLVWRSFLMWNNLILPHAKK